MKAKIVESGYNNYQCFELYTKKHWWSSWVLKYHFNTVVGALLFLSRTTEGSAPIPVIMSKSIIDSLRLK